MLEPVWSDHGVLGGRIDSRVDVAAACVLAIPIGWRRDFAGDNVSGHGSSLAVSSRARGSTSGWAVFQNVATTTAITARRRRLRCLGGLASRTVDINRLITTSVDMQVLVGISHDVGIGNRPENSLHVYRKEDSSHPLG